ncbi:hypothetical protein KKB69_01040 [Patescibacteria group bacterium]|nr:hypothetical protein [Patescibacteria group bacterium]
MSKGFVNIIILIIIAVIVLGYFKIDLRSIWNSEPVQNNLGFLWESARIIWHNYLSEPANFVWGIFYNYIWLSFIENMQRIKMGEKPAILDNTSLPTFQVESQ